LQRQAGLEQLAKLKVAWQIVVSDESFDRDAGAFMDTAALMKNLDLVITSDTAVAHLAGAMGIPVWLALSSHAEWRWLEGRSDSPWYPTMRLFRQLEPGDWRSVIERMAGELQPLAANVAARYRSPTSSSGNTLHALSQSERRITSQNGEDGILDAIFSQIGTTNKFFVEFGCGDGSECNTARLDQRCGWRGVLMDGQPGNGMGGLQIHREFITAENINALFAKYSVPHEFDLLSIDIDGNDYWIWKAIRHRPRVVVIEYNASIAQDEALVLPYSSDFCWDGTDYFGASLRALQALGNSKGYELIYCERAGVNAFFVAREALPEEISSGGLSELYRPANYFWCGLSHRRSSKRLQPILEP
jgi:hypothetical protein